MSAGRLLRGPRTGGAGSIPRPLAAVAGLLVSLAACAAPTPYQPALDREGYAEQRIEENRYRVSFAGNAATPRETVETYLLYRAAELTESSGHEYFVIVDRETNREVYPFYAESYPAAFAGHFPRHHFFFGHRFGHHFGHRFGHHLHPFGHHHGHGFGFGYGFHYTPPLETFEAAATVLLFKGKKPADDPDAYDARDVLDKLGPAIVRPPPPPPA